ncbi:MAG: hypothetical protein ACUVQK_15080 [Thermogutta sp.]
MHESTKRLLFFAGLTAAWLVPGLVILAVLVGRLRPSYRDGWRKQLTAATGLHAEFSAVEHPLPRAVRFPKATFRDPLGDNLKADCESLLVTHGAADEWQVQAEAASISIDTVRAWADRLARELSQPRSETVPAWRITADHVLIHRQNAALWRGAAFRCGILHRDGLPGFRATCRPVEDDPDLPPIAVQITVRRQGSDRREHETTVDTGGRYLPLELCRAFLGRNPQVGIETQADFKGTISVRVWGGTLAHAPFAPDPNSEETIVSGELRCLWKLPADGTGGEAGNAPPPAMRIRLDRLRLQNGQAVDGKATVVEARGLPPSAVEDLFYRLVSGSATPAQPTVSPPR